MTLKLTSKDYAALAVLLESYGGTIIATDLEPIYQKFPAPSAIRRQFYTSLSDGKYIFVDNSRVSDKNTLAWDIAHLIGHMFQWGTKRATAKALGLKYYGAKARHMAIRDFRGASDRILSTVVEYEFEANCIAYGILLRLRKEKRTSAFAEEFRKFVEADLSFIVGYYYQERRRRAADNARSDPVLGPVLKRIGRTLRVVRAPKPTEMQFGSYDILSVPVVHES
ncbi:MAG TPA: hypothetical protein VG889_18740 [Rhizomicrobium sp.]|nr:hypothetical protein [Rhizomicrobium sp.]